MKLKRYFVENDIQKDAIIIMEGDEFHHRVKEGGSEMLGNKVVDGKVNAVNKIFHSPIL